MALTLRPDGWSAAKLAALNELLDTASAFLLLDRILTAANDTSAGATALRADLVKLGKAQLVTLKQL